MSPNLEGVGGGGRGGIAGARHEEAGKRQKLGKTRGWRLGGGRRKTKEACERKSVRLLTRSVAISFFIY